MISTSNRHILNFFLKDYIVVLYNTKYKHITHKNTTTNKKRDFKLVIWCNILYNINFCI